MICARMLASAIATLHYLLLKLGNVSLTRLWRHQGKPERSSFDRTELFEAITKIAPSRPVSPRACCVACAPRADQGVHGENSARTAARYKIGGAPLFSRRAGWNEAIHELLLPAAGETGTRARLQELFIGQATSA